MIPYEALQHAVQAHDGEWDKCNLPAVLHPIEVSHKLRNISPTPFGLQFVLDIRVVAYLHDVLEDTSYPRHRLGRLTEPQWDALDRITRVNETYDDYIERVCGSQISGFVKLADLHTNMNRPPIPGEPMSKRNWRLDRYRHARDTIHACLGTNWWPDA